MSGLTDILALQAVQRKLRNHYGPLRAAFLGDSITLQNGVQISNIHGSTSYATQLQALCGGKLSICRNAGIPGDTSQGMAKRIGGDVLAYKPDVVFILTGTNDYNSSNVLATALGGKTTVGWIEDMVKACLAINAMPVLQSICPTGSANAALAAGIISRNAAIRALASEYGLVYIDSHAQLADASGYWISAAYSSDNVHPTDFGARVMARAAYAAISGVLPSWERRGTMTAFANSAAADGWNAIDNGAMMPLTPGDTAATTASGWTIYSTARTYSRIDGDGEIVGNWQRFAWNAGAATGTTYMESTSLNLLSKLRGKRVSMRMKYRMSAGNETAGNSVEMYIEYRDSAGASIITARCTGRVDGTGYLQCEDTVPANAYYVYVRIGAVVADATAAGTIDVGDVSCTEIDAPITPGVASVQKPQRISLPITANTTLTIDDAGIILVDATAGVVTITLPSAKQATYGFNVLYGGFCSAIGFEYTVIKIDASANAVTVQRAGSDTIEGATSISLAAQWNKAKLVSVGVASFVRLT